jgi:hypothetical protein
MVATPITSLFNLSIVLSEIPKDWKAAAVIPLFKGGPKLLRTYSWSRKFTYTLAKYI